MQTSSDLKAQAALLSWAASLPYCTGLLYWHDLSNFCGCPNFCTRTNIHHFLWKIKNSISASKCPITAPKICTWSLLLSKFSYHTHELLNGGRPRLWARLPRSGHNPVGGEGGGGGNETQAGSPVIAFIGGSEKRGGGRRGEGEQICPCTKCSHVHVVSTLSLFLISPFCCCSLSRYKKVPRERNTFKTSRKFFFPSFFLITVGFGEGTFTHSSKINSHKEVTKQ